MKKKFFIVTVLLTLLLTITGLSYAYWIYKTEQSGKNKISSECFEVSMLEESEGITLEKAYPMSDEEGMKEKGYTFTIQNTCSTLAYYQVNLEELKLPEEIKRLKDENIKVSLNDSKGKELNSYQEVEPTIKEVETDVSHKLTSGSLEPEERVTYNLKIWLKEETPAEEENMEATFQSKVSITASYMEEEAKENEIAITSESKNEGYSKEKERITITATSENYNIIEYSYDKKVFETLEPSKKVTIEKEETKEGRYPVYFKDEVGNIQEEYYETSKLDQTPPTIEVEEESGEKGAILTIHLNDAKSGLSEYKIEDEVSAIDLEENWQPINGNTEDITYESTENKTIVIKVKDVVGNIKEEKHEITKVDTTGPTIRVENPHDDEWTSEDVTITINAEDDMSGVDKFYYKKQSDERWTEIEESNVTITEKNGSATIKINTNTNETYEFKATDKMGNTSNIERTIVKVDKEEPTLEIQTEVQNNQVKVMVEGQDNVEIKIYRYQIDTEEWVEKEEETHTFENVLEGSHTIRVEVKDEAGNKNQKEKEVEVYYDRKIEIIGLNSTIEDGKVFTNLIKNGGYEEGNKDWILNNTSIVTTEHYEGNHALKFSSGSNVTAMSQQLLDISAPELNHEYYGSLMYKSPVNFKGGDSRFEFRFKDSVDGKLNFEYRTNISTNGNWEKVSKISKIINETNLSQQWQIRNFVVNGNYESYTDNLLMIDLTETFGETNPTKEWLDKNVDYFDKKAGYFVNTIKSNGSINVTLKPEEGYNFESVICDYAQVERNENTYTIQNPTADTVCKIKYKEDQYDLTILAETSTISEGKKITNLIQNGGYEEGNHNWSLSNASVVNTEHYEGNYALKFSAGNITAMSMQKLSIVSPKLNHNYYGSIMVKSPTGFTSGDSRYQIHIADDEKAALITFANKINVNKNGTWEKISGVGAVTVNTYLSNQWNVRNFYVNPSQESYTDNLLMIDLTETFGETNPVKVWLDEHVNYFPSTANLYQGKMGSTMEIPITIDSGYGYEKVECSNSNATYSNGKLQITNATGEVICHLKTKDKNPPIAKIKSASVSGSSITIDASTSMDQESEIKTYYYSINGGTNWTSSSTNSYTFTNVSNGEHSISVKVQDYAGNESSKVDYGSKLVVDEVVPVITMLNTGTYDFNDTRNIGSATYGPLGGSLSCVNTTMSNASVTTLQSLKGIGSFIVKCTASGNNGKSTSKTVTYNMLGTLNPSNLFAVNGTKTDSEITLPNGSSQYGPYYKATKGCYKVTYTGTGFDERCTNLDSYQNNPGLTFEIKPRAFLDTSFHYYLNVPNDVSGTGVELFLKNTCSTTTTLKNIKVEKANDNECSSLNLFYKGKFNGTYSHQKALTNAIDYITIGNTIHFNDNDTNQYGNSLLSFDTAVNLSNYNKITVNFKVNSISGASDNYPCEINLAVFTPTEFELMKKADNFEDPLLTTATVYTAGRFSKAGAYSFTLDVTSLKDNYNIAMRIHSHQWMSYLLDLDVTSVVLSP